MDIPFSNDGESAVERKDRLIKRCKPCFILITRSSYIDGMVEEGMDDESTADTSMSEVEMTISEPLISENQIVFEVGSMKNPTSPQQIMEEPPFELPISEHEIPEEALLEAQTYDQENFPRLVPQQPISQPQIQPHEIVSEVGSMKNPYAISKNVTICEKNLLEQPFNIHKSVRNQEVGLMS
uniref:Uncharacterized protein n=1 Tax=Tetranychus urticae TaxID=32264 RepID=T1JV72_TETUR